MLFLVAVVLAVLMSLVQMLYQALQKCCSRVYNCKSKKTKKKMREKKGKLCKCSIIMFWGKILKG